MKIFKKLVLSVNQIEFSKGTFIPSNKMPKGGQGTGNCEPNK